MAVYLNQGKTKMLKFLAGITGSVQITHFVVGDAPYYTPTADQTALRSQVLKKAVTDYSQDTANTVTYECQLGLADCVGLDITELGLLDEDGLLVAVKTFPAKNKTSDAEMTFFVTDDFNGFDIIYLTDNVDNNLIDNRDNDLIK